ncbi:ABC transporter substrate-binding protein [Pontibaca methylaminivorans]|uniref:ABC transporter substrate-binding protein n=1 Tax=Pontibaca methylaminivorans TaxID=515897 RepID=UPI002FD90268
MKQLALRGPALIAMSVLTAAATPGAAAPSESGFPVTVSSCEREITISAPPRRALVNGSNLIEIMLALGLEDRLAGYSGRTVGEATLRAFPAAAGLRAIQRSYPTLETFLDEGIDFYFAGWSYGMRVGGEVTPESLGRYGIPVYELSESCVRLGQHQRPDFDVLFRDLENLARIFGVPERAAALIAQYRARLARVAADIAAGTGALKAQPRVFVYDSGDKVPLTAGGYAMPQAIIEAAGGENIAAMLDNSWVRIDWETVADLDPEAVVIVDYGEISARDKIAFFKTHPALSHVGAVRNDRFLVLSYDELTPGPRNIDAVEKLAAFLHGRPR